MCSPGISLWWGYESLQQQMARTVFLCSVNCVLSDQELSILESQRWDSLHLLTKERKQQSALTDSYVGLYHQPLIFVLLFSNDMYVCVNGRCFWRRTSTSCWSVNGSAPVNLPLSLCSVTPACSLSGNALWSFARSSLGCRHSAEASSQGQILCFCWFYNFEDIHQAKSLIFSTIILLFMRHYVINVKPSKQHLYIVFILDIKGNSLNWPWIQFTTTVS